VPESFRSKQTALLSEADISDPRRDRALCPSPPCPEALVARGLGPLPRLSS
jgi:hypothetical protein